MRAAIPTFVAALLGCAMPHGTAAAAPLKLLKSQIAKGVEARAKLAQEVNDSIFSFSELGFQEFETSRYVTAILEKNGFTVTRGVAGLPTGWVARWTHGSGGPVVALGSDLDCIPKASQKPGIPYHDPLIEGAPGHGEGHNSGHAVNIVAALVLKEMMERENIPGTLMLWPGVAEELVAGKAFMVREGVFKDVDAVIFNHVGDNFETFWGRPDGTGMVSVRYSFEGESAHAANAPWRGRSALDAVELMNIGWNMRREHLRPEQRSHYVIADGGDQPNVVPSRATVWYYFREQDFQSISRLFAIGNQIAEGAAKMTATTVTHRVLGSAAPRHFNKPLAEAAYANIQAVGLPRWSDGEQAFSRLVQRNVGLAKQEGLATVLSPLRAPAPEPKSGGSDDIGDVSWVVPTINIRYPANIPHLPGHHWSNAVTMATPIAHKGIIAGAKAAAMTALDFFTQPNLRKATRAYFVNVQTKEQKYVPMIGPADKPPIEINREIMDRYRPDLQKFYYDPTKYKTYLDQLGIKFPMTEVPSQ